MKFDKSLFLVIMFCACEMKIPKCSTWQNVVFSKICISVKMKRNDTIQWDLKQKTKRENVWEKRLDKAFWSFKNKNGSNWSNRSNLWVSVVQVLFCYVSETFPTKYTHIADIASSKWFLTKNTKVQFCYLFLSQLQLRRVINNVKEKNNILCTRSDQFGHFTMKVSFICLVSTFILIFAAWNTIRSLCHDALVLHYS